MELSGSRSAVAVQRKRLGVVWWCVRMVDALDECLNRGWTSSTDCLSVLRRAEKTEKRKEERKKRRREKKKDQKAARRNAFALISEGTVGRMKMACASAGPNGRHA